MESLDRKPNIIIELEKKLNQEFELFDIEKINDAPVEFKPKTDYRRYSVDEAGEIVGLNISGFQSGYPLTEISFLKELKHLTVLNLSGNSSIRDISVLSEFKKLEKLDLSLNSIHDLSPLKKLTNLTHLSVSSNDFNSIEALSNLDNLIELEIAGGRTNNRISDISVLKNLIKLEKLDIMYQHISDISVLKNFQKLKSLNAYNNKISDISVLQNLKELKYLNLGENKISDISVLQNLNKLENIDISDNLIPNFQSLYKLNTLKGRLTNFFFEHKDFRFKQNDSMAERFFKYIEFNINNNKKETLLDKNKVLPINIMQVSLNNFLGIDNLKIENIPIDSQWIFLTGENGFGKSSILKGIASCLFGKYIDMNNSFIEFNDHDFYHMNVYSKEFNFIIKFEKFAAYGAKRFDLSDGYFSDKLDNLFEERGKTELYDFETKYVSWKASSGVHDDKILKLNDLLTAVVPNLSKIGFDNEKSEVIYFEKTDIGEEFPPVTFQQLAMGMRSTIAMIVDFAVRLSNENFDFKIENGVTDLAGIVIIDEFDNHLHPKWQKMLVEKLTKLFPKIQFIVSTHSPIPLLGAPANSVILNVNRTKEEGITIKKLDIDFTTLTPNSILTSPVFGLTNFLPQAIQDLSKLHTEDGFDEILFNQEVERRINQLANFQE